MQIFRKTAVITVLVFPLSACGLATNVAPKEAKTIVHTDAWFHHPDALSQTQKGLSAYLALDDAFLSIATRIHLIQHAKYHLDLQYYIWKDDEIGHLMLSELLKAADRGVKVRLLIDDQNGTGLDETLRQLSYHPNFEIKLFNPYRYRHFRVLDYAFRLNQINHRMHNKLIIADGAVAVTGGRNISREYFDASDDFQFTDMDIFFAGHSVQDANQIFLEFWNDRLSYSTLQLMGEASKSDLDIRRKKYAQPLVDDAKTQHKILLAQQKIAQQLQKRPIRWAKTYFIADHPNKIRGQAQQQQLIYKQMFNIMGQPKQHLELVSAYFVPTDAGTQYLTQLSQNHVQVSVLTNSFLANDVPLVHAFYQKYRKTLLKHQVKLYEFKPYIEREQRTWYEVMTGNVIPAKGKNASSLHAKFFDIDGMVFIGSFNFDPRSAHLNTEVGLVIESDQLQNEISQSLEQSLARIAYELKLDHKGDIIWLEHQKDGSIRYHDVDPETTPFQRFMIQVVSYLPIEWML